MPASGKHGRLSAKEQAAVEYYCNPGSDSYNVWTDSYKKANYSLCKYWKRNAKKVYDKDHIQVAIRACKAKIVEKIDVTTDEIIRELRKLAGLDEGAKGLNNAERIRSLELLGKHLEMFKDIRKDVSEQQRKLSESERAEADRLAKELLKPAIGLVKEA